MSSTFYNNKDIKEVQPQIFKHDVFKGTANNFNNLNAEESVMTQFSVSPRPIELKDASKMKRFIKNSNILQMLKVKLQQNPQKLPEIIQAFVKVNLGNTIYGSEYLQLSGSQYENLVKMILQNGYSQDLVASFEIKDLIRHGLLIEDYTVRL